MLFDDKQRQYSGTINQITSEGLSVTIETKKEAKLRHKTKICLGAALPKKAKFDFLVEKATELGADIIIPLETERTIVKVPQEKRVKVLNRWKHIALNASEQSKRISVPKIEPIQDFKSALDNVKNFDLKLIACLNQSQTIKEVLKKFSTESVVIFIGPEGDFSKREVDLALKSGFIPVSLGALTLKVDTACLAAMAVLNFALA